MVRRYKDCFCNYNNSLNDKHRKKIYLVIFSITILVFSVFSNVIGFSNSLQTYAISIKNKPSTSVVSEKEKLTKRHRTAEIHSAIKTAFFADLTVTINSGKQPSANNFNITKGYKIEPFIWNLTLPSNVAFDENGNMYIAEAGYAYGEF